MLHVSPSSRICADLLLHVPTRSEHPSRRSVATQSPRGSKKNVASLLSLAF
ncbi:hypothetical protein VFPBJ_00934 [Purpureocillium lilacinum]|uniref:Uncharacterized protein n=1 Tax=Purpureocillium lilacinum TaxID=33203 RepID=A0A179H9R7_PURLI|nr:hypothetical protein VFPBJ_00934 [Purpureocillium lilacinum]